MATNKVKGTDLQQAMPKATAQPDYDTEDALRTLHQASGIMSDKSKLAKVHKLAGRRHKALQAMVEPMLKQPKPVRSMQDLKDRAAKVNKPPMDDDGDDE